MNVRQFRFDSNMAILNSIYSGRQAGNEKVVTVFDFFQGLGPQWLEDETVAKLFLLFSKSAKSLEEKKSGAAIRTKRNQESTAGSWRADAPVYSRVDYLVIEDTTTNPPKTLLLIHRSSCLEPEENSDKRLARYLFPSLATRMTIWNDWKKNRISSLPDRQLQVQLLSIY